MELLFTLNNKLSITSNIINFWSIIIFVAIKRTDMMIYYFVVVVVVVVIVVFKYLNFHEKRMKYSEFLVYFLAE